MVNPKGKSNTGKKNSTLLQTKSSPKQNTPIKKNETLPSTFERDSFKNETQDHEGNRGMKRSCDQFEPQQFNRGSRPQSFDRGSGPQNFSRGFGPRRPQRGFGPQRPQRGFGPRRSQRGLMYEAFNSNKIFLKYNSAKYVIVRVCLPHFNCDKLALEQMLKLSYDMKLGPQRIVYLQVDRGSLKQKLTTLRQFSCEGRKLDVELYDELTKDPVKLLIKFSNFGVDLEEVKNHYGAISIEQLSNTGAINKPHYILTFESQEVAEDAWKKDRSSFEGQTANLSNYYQCENKRTSKVVTEPNEGSAAKKIKTDSGAKLGKDEEDEAEEEEEDDAAENEVEDEEDVAEEEEENDDDDVDVAEDDDDEEEDD